MVNLPKFPPWRGSTSHGTPRQRVIQSLENRIRDEEQAMVDYRHDKLAASALGELEAGELFNHIGVDEAHHKVELMELLYEMKRN